jgi:transketolase
MAQEGAVRAQETAGIHRAANRIRLHATRMVAIQGFGYLGQALSAAEIFAVLFCGGHLRKGHDRFVLSPGHYAIALYAAAVEAGLLEAGELSSYGADAARLEAIGSLGQGLSAAVGFALAAALAGEDRVTYAFVSDGEMEEGQVWEAAMFAAHHRGRMGPLKVIIDANNSQVDGPVTSVTTLEPLADKWRAFGWSVREVDGHDPLGIDHALRHPAQEDRPLVVIARTDILGRMRSIPRSADGHFIKLDAALCKAVLAELESAGA